MVTLKQALVEAGIDPEGRIVELEDRIVADKPSIDEALDLYFAEVSGDAALLWLIFADVRREICVRRLRAAMQRRKDGEAKHEVPSGHAALASPAGAARGLNESPNHADHAPRPTAALRFHEARTAVTAVARTVLDTWATPLGRSIGNITGAEAKTLNERSRRDAKVYAYAASHTPPDELVKDFVRASDLEAIIRAADRENEHAE